MRRLTAEPDTGLYRRQVTAKFLLFNVHILT
jgi:hypothetical protein